MAFGATSTADEVLAGVDLEGRRVLVTGGYRGLGRETARALASAGAQVTIAGRDGDRLTIEQQALGVATGRPIATLVIDLADQASVRRAAEEFGHRHDRLDVLINNAGVMGCGYQLTPDGHEMQFAVNHLGHFALTQRLTPLLLAAAPSRVVNLSSTGHRTSGIRWDDLHFQRDPYDKYAAYGQSKTANVLHVVGLQARLGAHGVDAFAVMPGVIFTALSRHLTREDIADLTDRAAQTEGGGLQVKSVEAGAATTVWCATAPALTGRGGLYCEDCRVARPAADADNGSGFEPHAVDPAGAERLWRLSESLTAAGGPATR
ncbi:MAG: SDR family NAD(P)-dependent oxidoreductase [Acidimicrobiia bacterium]|nr:SDR family NAD(P)-dependent oxidoreductase [Acidimicrobiia bacterium]